MWDKVRKFLAASLAVLATLALAVGYAMRKRATAAGEALAKGRERDALERGREEEARARLQIINGELAKTEKLPRPSRTAAQILEEQRRRGQLIE